MPYHKTKRQIANSPQKRKKKPLSSTNNTKTTTTEDSLLNRKRKPLHLNNKSNEKNVLFEDKKHSLNKNKRFKSLISKSSVQYSSDSEKDLKDTKNRNYLSVEKDKSNQNTNTSADISKRNNLNKEQNKNLNSKQNYKSLEKRYQRTSNNKNNIKDSKAYKKQKDIKPFTRASSRRASIKSSAAIEYNIDTDIDMINRKKRISRKNSVSYYNKTNINHKIKPLSLSQKISNKNKKRNTDLKLKEDNTLSSVDNLQQIDDEENEYSKDKKSYESSVQSRISDSHNSYNLDNKTKQERNVKKKIENTDKITNAYKTRINRLDEYDIKNKTKDTKLGVTNNTNNYKGFIIDLNTLNTDDSNQYNTINTNTRSKPNNSLLSLTSLPDNSLNFYNNIDMKLDNDLSFNNTSKCYKLPGKYQVRCNICFDYIIFSSYKECTNCIQCKCFVHTKCLNFSFKSQNYFELKFKQLLSSSNKNINDEKHGNAELNNVQKTKENNINNINNAQNDNDLNDDNTNNHITDFLCHRCYQFDDDYKKVTCAFCNNHEGYLVNINIKTLLKYYKSYNNNNNKKNNKKFSPRKTRQNALSTSNNTTNYSILTKKDSLLEEIESKSHNKDTDFWCHTICYLTFTISKNKLFDFNEFITELISINDGQRNRHKLNSTNRTSQTNLSLHYNNISEKKHDDKFNLKNNVTSNISHSNNNNFNVINILYKKLDKLESDVCKECYFCNSSDPCSNNNSNSIKSKTFNHNSKQKNLNNNNKNSNKQGMTIKCNDSSCNRYFHVKCAIEHFTIHPLSYLLFFYNNPNIEKILQSKDAFSTYNIDNKVNIDYELNIITENTDNTRTTRKIAKQHVKEIDDISEDDTLEESSYVVLNENKLRKLLILSQDKAFQKELISSFCPIEGKYMDYSLERILKLNDVSNKFSNMRFYCQEHGNCVNQFYLESLDLFLQNQNYFKDDCKYDKNSGVNSIIEKNDIDLKNNNNDVEDYDNIMNIDNEDIRSACSIDKSLSNKSIIGENESKDIDVEKIKERIIEENYNESSSKYSNKNSDKSSASSVNNNENVNIENNICIDLTNKSNLTTIKEELGNLEVSIDTNIINNDESKNNSDNSNNIIDSADISNNISINFKKDDSNNTKSSTYGFNKFYNYTTKIIPDNEKLLRKSSNNLSYVITSENNNLDSSNKTNLVNPGINHDYDYCIENSHNNNLTNNYNNEECLFNINNNISNAFVNNSSQINTNNPPIFNHQSNSNILNTSYISNTSCNNLNNFNARFNSYNQNYQNNQSTLNFQNLQNLNSSFSNNNYNLFSQSQNKLSSPISNYRHFDLNLNKSNNNSLYLNTNTYNNVNFDENDKDDLFSAFNSHNDLENITVLSKLQSKMNSRNTSKRKNKISEYERKIDFGYGSIYNNIDNNDNDVNINNNTNNTAGISKGFNYEKLVIDRRPVSLDSLNNNDNNTKDEDSKKMIVDNEADNDIKEDNSNRNDSKNSDNSNNSKNSVSNNYNTNQTHTNTNKEISESKNELSIYNVGEFVFEGNKIDITNKTPNKYTKLSMDCYTFGGNSQNNSNMIPINHAENNNIVKIRDFSIDNNNNFTNNNTYPTNNTLTSNSLNNYNNNIASYNPNNNINANNNINNIPRRNLSKSFKNTLSIDETITDRSYYNNSSDSLCFESFSFSLNDDSNTNIRNAFRKYRMHIEEDISNLNRKGYSNISVTEIHEIQDFITLFCRHYPNYFYDSFDEIIDSSGLENYLRRRKAKERRNKDELANNIISSSNSAIPTINNIEKKDIVCKSNTSLSYKNNKEDKKEDDSSVDN